MGDVGVEITVRGEAERRVAPTRGVIAVSAHAVDAEHQASYDRAVAAAARVRAEIVDLPVAARGAWSVGEVATYVERPWTEQGRGVPEHHAIVASRVEILDLARVGMLVDAWGTRDALELGGVTWGISPAERAEAERQARTDAVAVAARRARDLGAAIGRTTIQLCELADVGLLGDGRSGAFGLMAKATHDTVAIGLVPADV
ncbi:MAG TPA: SIMPL domain-containing protein, partial [Iamia sp.]|nr:SIMPL domain-containing protein [Iamia sp.]